MILFALFSPARADDQYAFDFIPNSGDIWLDVRLGDLNAYASDNIDGFIDEVVLHYGAPRHLVREYVVERHWPPGDVYYACALAYYGRRSCSTVLNWYEHHNHPGWGGLARQVGVTSATAAFRGLKDNLGESHDKWQGNKGNSRKPEDLPGRGNDNKANDRV